MTKMRVVGAVAATAIGFAVLAAGSSLGLAHRSGDRAILRLSFSVRPERIESCRTLSEEELAQLAAHMRQRVRCEGTTASYALVVMNGGDVIAENVIRGGGLRHDRPIHLLREHPITPGESHIRVTLERREAATQYAIGDVVGAPMAADTGIFAGRAAREAGERLRGDQASVPAMLSLDTTLTLSPRRVALVTFNADRKQLELRTGDGPQ